jgi:hypothetical protein
MQLSSKASIVDGKYPQQHKGKASAKLVAYAHQFIFLTNRMQMCIKNKYQ